MGHLTEIFHLKSFAEGLKIIFEGSHHGRILNIYSYFVGSDSTFNILSRFTFPFQL